MFVGSFGGDFLQFQQDTVNAFAAFKDAGVTQLLIDLTNNGGGFVCLGQFLHQFLAGSQSGYPFVWSIFKQCVLLTNGFLSHSRGFQTTQRGNALAQKIVANDIKLGVTQVFYAPQNCGDRVPCRFLFYVR